jgi:hypothetical protein
MQTDNPPGSYTALANCHSSKGGFVAVRLEQLLPAPPAWAGDQRGGPGRC